MAKERARRLLNDLITQRGNSYADISRLIGRNAAYIQQFIKRGTPRKLDEQDREIIARYFGVSEHLLGASSTDERAPSPPDASKIICIPRLALGVSAGAGTLDEDERPAGALVFDAQWLRGLSPHPTDLSMVQVKGESMAPTLENGDEIMVDPHDDAARLRDGIYVLRLDGVLMVKRIAIGPRRNIFSVLSDNPHYPDWSEIEPDLVEILGRVVWIGRALQ